MKRICVIRLDALGDTLLSTPALNSLRHAFPESQLTVYASPPGSRVLEGLGRVRVVQPGEGPSEIGRELRAYQPDCVLVFTEKRAGYLGAYLSRAPVRAGFDPGLSQPLKAVWLRLALTDRLAYPNDQERDPGMHEVERYQRLVEVVGVPTGEPGPLRVPLSPEQESRGKEWLTGHNLVKPVGFQLTPKWCLDGWPPDFVKRSLLATPEPKLALYGPAERIWAEPLLRDTGVVSCCFADLMQYAAVLKGCRALVTPDTGAVHVASAVGTSVVDVFPTRHHKHCVRRWRPWQVPHRVVLKPEYAAADGPGLLERILTALAELAE